MTGRKTALAADPFGVLVDGADAAREELVQRACNGDARSSQWDLATDKQRAKAIAKADAVRRSRELVTVHGLSQGAADAQAGCEMRPRRSKRSVEGYREKTLAQGLPEHEWTQALLDKPKSGRPRKDFWEWAGAQTLWGFFETDYLREEAPPGEAVRCVVGRGFERFYTWTSRRPKRAAELAGGSVYFVGGKFRNQTLFRMPYVEVEEDGHGFAIVLRPQLIRVEQVSVGQVRGWRYFDSSDAPPDANSTDLAEPRAEFPAGLRETGLA